MRILIALLLSMLICSMVGVSIETLPIIIPVLILQILAGIDSSVFNRGREVK